jgi:hypothetical protein
MAFIDKLDAARIRSGDPDDQRGGRLGIPGRKARAGAFRRFQAGDELETAAFAGSQGLERIFCTHGNIARRSGMHFRPAGTGRRDNGRHYGFGALIKKGREKIFEGEKGCNGQTSHQKDPFYNSHTIESILQVQEIQNHSSVKKNFLYKARRSEISDNRASCRI